MARPGAQIGRTPGAKVLMMADRTELPWTQVVTRKGLVANGHNRTEGLHKIPLLRATLQKLCKPSVRFCPKPITACDQPLCSRWGCVQFVSGRRARPLDLRFSALRGPNPIARSETPTDSRDDGLPITCVRCHSRGERGLLRAASALLDQSKVLTRGFEHPRTPFGLSREIQPWTRCEGSSQSDDLRTSCGAYHHHPVHGTFSEGRRSMIP